MELAVSPAALADAGRVVTGVAGAVDDVRVSLAAHGRSCTAAFEPRARAAADDAVDAWVAALGRLADAYGHLGRGLADVAAHYATADAAAVRP